MTDRFPSSRPTVAQLRASRIREVANEGMGRSDVLPFWFGESAWPTPALIRDAAKAALDEGATRYSQNLGLPALREALAAYASELHGATGAEHVAVTSAGVNALMLAAQLVLEPGDRVVAVTPLWPNLVEIPRILGASVECVPLDYGRAGWTLDLDKLLAALTPGTRALLVNSPNNPTGWAMTAAQQQAVLDHCRRNGTWIIADEVYERLYFAEPGRHCAPSFLDIACRDEQLICVNSFSKAWLMTGWRLGWMVLSPRLAADLEKLIEYNTSCAPAFVQQAGIVAVREGAAITRDFVAGLRLARDELVTALKTLPEIDVQSPAGAMYVFFRIAGVTDSLALCKRLVREAGLGLAPGSAFGDEGEGFVRWCYACDTDRLQDGVGRLRAFLAGA